MSAFVIQNVRLFDGFRVHDGPCSVQVSEGKIERIESSSSLGTANRLSVIDGSGCTLLPSLIDAHVHVFRGVDEVKRALAAGVTTLFDMHNTPSNATYMKDLSRQSNELPEVFSAFHAATVDGGWPRAIVRHTTDDPTILASLADYPKLDTPRSAFEFVAKNKSMGADFIKLMQESAECLTFQELPAPSKELQKAVIDAAKEHDLLTFAHATNLRETLLVLDAGVSAMAHQFFDQAHTEEVIASYKKTNAFVVPTLTAISSMMGLGTAKTWAGSAQADKLLTDSSRHLLCDCMRISSEGCSVQYAYRCVKALKANGIDIICGTDSGPTIHGTALGAAVHLEMALYVEHCAFTPVEALQSATSLSAKRLRLADRGVIASGKRADLLLVRGNPTEDIKDSTNVEKVWKAGHLCNVH
ncbi:hypothetical protein LTR09_011756 [Extremus antarcticus]|uniref:Amidohydrolase-related domain-containing protein n=1 Tax=Extremus antarcticus TaxID=702011 RepID=A0AAJ0GA05_9PEZI|nr:hypothetical protein LTR09_011756 [Extremus antarcticus]